MLASFQNDLGWGSQYNINVQDHFLKYLIYTIFFILGIFIANSINISKSDRTIYLNLTNFKIIVLLSFFFMLIKFVNIQNIPLINNPMSRYEYSLGGFPDYPTRFLPVISIFCFWIYMQTKKKTYLYLTALAILLPLLFLQRQDALTGVLGIVITQSFQKSFSMSKILRYSFFIIAVLLIIIGGGAIVRYGKDTLSSEDLSILELAITIVHGDLSVASQFGAYVTENIGDFYHGLYSFGEYLSILTPHGSFVHGAALMQQQFTDRVTAQSVAIPFSYYIDFGYYGIVIFSVLSGFILKYLQLKTRQSQNIFFAILYILFFMELLWSLRSGTLPFRPIFIYQSLLLFFIFIKRSYCYSYIIKPAVIFMFSLSFLFMFIRF
jgi:oligosaccharide repeat unit polymerase